MLLKFILSYPINPHGFLTYFRIPIGSKQLGLQPVIDSTMISILRHKAANQSVIPNKGISVYPKYMVKY